MLSRTTTSLVTFVHPFVVAGRTDKLPPDSYELFAEGEVTQSPCFMANRRTGPHLLIRRALGGFEPRPVDHRGLEIALTPEQVSATRHKNSEAALAPSKDLK